MHEAFCLAGFLAVNLYYPCLYTLKSIYPALTYRTPFKLQKSSLVIPTSNAAQGPESLGAGYDLHTFGVLVHWWGLLASSPCML